MVDLSHVPFVDGHMHPPLRVRPQTVDEYRWPWFEGLPSESAHVTELVPYRWAIRQLADELGCAADERAVVRATRELDPTTWLATVCERSQTVALVLDTGYPPPAESLPPEQIRAAGVEVAPLLRLEAMAGDLIAEGLAFGDLLERYDAAVERRARRRLRRAQEHRGLSQRAGDPPLERRGGGRGARAPARARRDAGAGAGTRRFPAAARAPGRPPRRPPCAAARRVWRPRSRPAPRQPPASARHALQRGGRRRALRRAARGLAVRARGRLSDGRLLERHARRRDLHSPARPRRATRGLALRPRGGGDPPSAGLERRGGPCRADRPRAQLAPARRSARCSASWSPAASCRPARPSACGESILCGQLAQAVLRRDLTTAAGHLIKCPAGLPYFAASPPLPGGSPHDPTHPSHRAARARGLCGCRRPEHRTERLGAQQRDSDARRRTSSSRASPTRSTMDNTGAFDNESIWVFQQLHGDALHRHARRQERQAVAGHELRPLARQARPTPSICARASSSTPARR